MKNKGSFKWRLVFGVLYLAVIIVYEEFKNRRRRAERLFAKK